MREFLVPILALGLSGFCNAQQVTRIEPHDFGSLIDLYGPERSEVSWDFGFHRNRGRNVIEISGLAIDVWEGGLLSKSHQEKWKLKVVDPPYNWQQSNKTNKPFSELEQTTIDRWGDNQIPFVYTSTFSTEKENLKIIWLDWKNGRMEFEFGLVRCVLLFNETSYEYDDINKKHVVTHTGHLKSLLGIETRQTPENQLITVEYKPSDYSYILNVPYEMKGLKKAESKPWHQLLATMSREDQEAWTEFRTRWWKGDIHKNVDSDSKEWFNEKWLDSLRAKFPWMREAERSHRKLTPVEEQNYKEALAEQFCGFYSKFFEKSKISPEGRKAMLDLIKAEIFATPLNRAM